MKVAAMRVGVDLVEYRRLIAAGKKFCFDCREWLPVDSFRSDKSRGDGRSAVCAVCRTTRHRFRYQPVAPDDRRPMGPARAPRRDGDKLQARSRINHDVRMGQRPDPNDLHCVACGHKGEDRRHEYHHHMGYAPDHHYDVLPLCSTCHHEAHPAETMDGVEHNGMPGVQP